MLVINLGDGESWREVGGSYVQGKLRTLSPMSSFASELGVQFEACMEAPHVIDVDSQVWAAVIPSGPGNRSLNASYKTADGYDFQDALGASLEEICKVVPGGALVFFPSYKLMEKLQIRWSHTGQWSRLNAEKPIFVEPRGNMDDFEPVLKGYYDSILGQNQVAPSKRKLGLKGLKRRARQTDTDESSQNPAKKGAVFLAVCRGKVSEGIDFSDENARAVVVVGIPFPNTNDIHIVLKKKYNDTYRSSKGLLSGSEWYCQQAFRALNQAAGRCIRHRFDYGAIIFLDERYKEERNVAHISKWLRNSIKQYSSFDESLEGLQTFFLDAQDRLSQKGGDAEKTDFVVDTSKENFSSEKNILNQHIPQEGNEKQNNLNFQSRRKIVSDNTTQHKNQLDNSFLRKSELENSSEVKFRRRRSAKAVCKRDTKVVDRVSQMSSIEPIATLDQYLVIEETTEHVDSQSVVPETCDEFSDRAYFSCPTISKRDPFEHAYTSIGSPERVQLSVNTSEQSLVNKNTMEDGALGQTCSHMTGRPSSLLSPEISKEPVSCSPEMLQSSISTLTESMIVKSTIEEGSLFSKLVQPCNQFSETEGMCCKSSFTSIGSPETVLVGFGISELESSLSTNVNSNSQRKRKLLGSQPGSSMQIDFSRSLDSECFSPVDSGRCISGDTNQRTESPHNLGSKNQKTMQTYIWEHSLALSSDVFIEKELHICCSSCKNSLGLPENKFLVTCSITSLSKVYLSYVLNHGPTSTCSSEELAKTPPTNMPVAVSEISFINPLILSRCIQKDASRNSFWSEEDGCVFKAVTCPFCTDPNVCLGVHVIATDASNTRLLNKILFYADNLDIRNGQTPEGEVMQSACTDAVKRRSSWIDIEKYAYNPPPKVSGVLPKLRSKLKLPKI